MCLVHGWRERENKYTCTGEFICLLSSYIKLHINLFISKMNSCPLVTRIAELGKWIGLKCSLLKVYIYNHSPNKGILFYQHVHVQHNTF